MILTGDEIDVGYDFDSLLKLNTAMGSAGVIALDERCCMVQLGIRVSEFYEHESCGKCTPCREGTRWMTQILRKLEAGDAAERELDLLLDVCDRINGKCLCPLGDTAAIAVASYVDKFRAEFVAHLDGGGCPFERPRRSKARRSRTRSAQRRPCHLRPSTVPRVSDAR